MVNLIACKYCGKFYDENSHAASFFHLGCAVIAGYENGTNILNLEKELITRVKIATGQILKVGIDDG